MEAGGPPSESSLATLTCQIPERQSSPGTARAPHGVHAVWLHLFCLASRGTACQHTTPCQPHAPCISDDIPPRPCRPALSTAPLETGRAAQMHPTRWHAPPVPDATCSLWHPMAALIAHMPPCHATCCTAKCALRTLITHAWRARARGCAVRSASTHCPVRVRGKG